MYIDLVKCGRECLRHESEETDRQTDTLIAILRTLTASRFYVNSVAATVNSLRMNNAT